MDEIDTCITSGSSLGVIQNLRQWVPFCLVKEILKEKRCYENLSYLYCDSMSCVFEDIPSKPNLTRKSRCNSRGRESAELKIELISAVTSDFHKTLGGRCAGENFQVCPGIFNICF